MLTLVVLKPDGSPIAFINSSSSISSNGLVCFFSSSSFSFRFSGLGPRRFNKRCRRSRSRSRSSSRSLDFDLDLDLLLSRRGDRERERSRLLDERECLRSRDEGGERDRYLRDRSRERFRESRRSRGDNERRERLSLMPIYVLLGDDQRRKTSDELRRTASE